MLSVARLRDLRGVFILLSNAVTCLRQVSRTLALIFANLSCEPKLYWPVRLSFVALLFVTVHGQKWRNQRGNAVFHIVDRIFRGFLCLINSRFHIISLILRDFCPVKGYIRASQLKTSYHQPATSGPRWRLTWAPVYTYTERGHH